MNKLWISTKNSVNATIIDNGVEVCKMNCKGVSLKLISENCILRPFFWITWLPTIFQADANSLIRYLKSSIALSPSSTKIEILIITMTRLILHNAKMPDRC